MEYFSTATGHTTGSTTSTGTVTASDLVAVDDLTVGDDAVVGDDLDVVGDLTAGTMISDAVVRSNSDGAAGTPAVAVGSGSVTEGIYKVTASTLGLAAGGAARAQISSAGFTLLNLIPFVLGGIFRLSTTVTPSALTGSVTDYNPTGWSTGTTLRLTADADASRTINSLGSVANDKLGILINADTAAARTKILLHDDGATGTAAQRILCSGGASLTIPVGGAALVWYDPTSTRWRAFPLYN